MKYLQLVLRHCHIPMPLASKTTIRRRKSGGDRVQNLLCPTPIMDTLKTGYPIEVESITTLPLLLSSVHGARFYPQVHSRGLFHEEMRMNSLHGIDGR